MSLAYRNSWWQAGRKCADMYAGDYYCIRGARFTLMCMQYTFVPPLTYSMWNAPLHFITEHAFVPLSVYDY